MWKPFDNRSRYSLLFAIEKISSENTLPKWFTYKKRFLSKIYPHFPIIEFFYLIYAGAHYQKPATTPCSCHGVFTDWSVFSLNLPRILSPTGISETNCNHQHGLMLTCQNDVDVFTWGRIVLSLPKCAHVHWNLTTSWEKYLKIDWSVKLSWHWLIMGVTGS